MVDSAGIALQNWVAQNQQGGGTNSFLDYQYLLPQTGPGYGQQYKGNVPGFGSAEQVAFNKYKGITSLQAQDFLTQMGFQGAFQPQYEQQQLNLQGQFIPQQLQQLGGFYGQAYNEALGSNPLLASLAQTAQSGLQDIGQGFGQLGGAYDKALGDQYGSAISRFGGEGSPAYLSSAATGFTLGKANLAEQLRQSRLQQAFGVNQMIGQKQSELMASTGLSDIGFGPMGFGGAAGLYGNSAELIAASRAGKQMKSGAWIGAAGGLASAAPGLYGMGKEMWGDLSSLWNKQAGV